MRPEPGVAWAIGFVSFAVLLAGTARAEPHAPAPDALQVRYGEALCDAVQATWLLPEGGEPGTRCRLSIQQLPGGDVLKARPLADCAFDATGRQSLIRAVHRASPLPYAGFEQVFSRSLVITFTAGAR